MMNPPYPLMISFAQQTEDVILRRLFADRAEGRYVDIGAGHPVEHSITKWFYDRGWSGINVEPQTDLHRRLCQERPRDRNVKCAIGTQDGDGVLTHFPTHWGWATTVEDVASSHQAAGLRTVRSEVPVRRLESVLDEHCDLPVDFLKVDAEGAEGAVLSSFDLSRWMPTVVVVEATLPNSPIYHAPWEPLLLDAGYVRTLFDGLNNFYVRRHDQERIALGSVPSNVFDNFIPFNWWRRLSSAHQRRLLDGFRRAGEDVSVLSLTGNELADLESVN
ncbi:methyltransferase, FkbM family [Streptomyces sp. TLI_053]|uniref:FkbM family methyltransferase n=1 Tax=Streptomyces sp. TLI_053 TaxID=1855352 RepID=UPI00087A8951|nr:FkbM family methyltransferase [Streptomyces sp. TLI_053]SDT83356.1 methyltransferase, FkbM family [Streptomyces sp. TLI_053]